MSDTCLDQACLPIKKTGVGIRRSADQVQVAYVGSIFQSSVLVEKATGHNQNKDILFVKATEKFEEIATLYPSQRQNQEEIDNSAYGNLLGKPYSIREISSFATSFSTAVWCLVICSPISRCGTTPICQRVPCCS